MAETAERRIKLLNALSRRRYDTVANLAVEFGVSERTIRRDIESLSTIEPIYTQTGRYAGGVYMLEGYYTDRKSLNADQKNVLERIVTCAQKGFDIVLSEAEINHLNDIIKTFSILH